jgi:RNA polymerase sigma factor (sigma-70 family)
MSSAPVGVLLRHLRTLASAGPDEGAPDHQLLERFVSRHDDAAFAVLVRRHGPMVLGVCRGVLHHEQDAEDAFQAAFLTLARKADAIHQRESVGGWLYRVAYHLAVKAQANAARRRANERRAEPMPSADPLLDMSLRELRGVLYEELERLPEKYRAPMVLCYLEEKPLDEAARLLGWSKGAIKGRLERGRQRLRKQLVRRGLAVPATLSALLLARGIAGARVAAALADSVLRAAPLAAAGQPVGKGLVSAGAAALLRGVTPSMFTSKCNFPTASLMAFGALAAAVGLLGHESLAAKPGKERPPAATALADGQERAAAGKAPPAQDASAEKVTVPGRVFGPDGKPVAGAKVYATYFSNEPLRNPVRATSGPDGRFSFAFPKSEFKPQADVSFYLEVLAEAAGYGADWEVFRGTGEVTLRLVKETTLRGRILDQDGRPVVGAHVHVHSIYRYPEAALSSHLDHVRRGIDEQRQDYEAIKGWPRGLPGQRDTLTTGADGRFHIPGLGPDDLVHFGIDGPGIHYTNWNQATTRATPTVAWPDNSRLLKIYGNRFDYLAAPGRAVRGTVRDKVTGKPVAGVRVSSSQTTHEAQADNDGRYELRGCPKGERYELTFVPPAGSLYFSAAGRFADAPGLGPLDGDIALVTGIPCRGRLTDGKTGLPVAGARVEYNALFPNPNILKLGTNVAYTCAATTTGKDGSYVLPVLPGPGALGFSAYRAKDPYMPAALDPKALAGLWNDGKNHGNDSGLMTALGPNEMGIMGLSNLNALYLLNPSEKASGVAQDAAVELGRTLTGRVVGPDGKPVRGVLVYGLGGNAFGSETLAGDTFTVQNLNPRGTRALLFYHEGKQLGRYLELQGEQRKPLVVNLEPCGSATGRLLDADGQPLADAVVQFYRSALLGPGAPRTTTGPDGRFRVSGLVPGQPYWPSRKQSFAWVGSMVSSGV